MPNQNLLPALSRALRVNEIGSGTPYKIGFAGKGQSGASFGFMQGDLNTGADFVRDCLRNVLAAGGVGAAKAAELAHGLSGKPLAANPLSHADAAEVDAALDSPAGRSLVDAMDERLLEDCFAGLDQCVLDAHVAGRRIAPEAQLAIALWVNMTGTPTTLIEWLEGSAVTMAGKVDAPGEYVTGTDMLAFVTASRYFTDNPRNLTTFEDAVADGAKSLPGAPSLHLFASEVGWYVFEQATGRFLQHGPTGDVVMDGNAYSGSFSAHGINDPSQEYVASVGPIPHGHYGIGAPYDGVTALMFPLTPMAGTDTRGRDGFLIHGGCKDNTRRASTGCVIANTTVRTKIASSGIRTLVVVHG